MDIGTGIANIVKISIARFNPNIYASGNDLRIQTTLALFSSFAQTLVTTSLISISHLVRHPGDQARARARAQRSHLQGNHRSHYTIRRRILPCATHMGNCMGIACVRRNASLYKTDMLDLCRTFLCSSLFL